MDEYELRLLQMIRKSDDPEKALVVAVEVITDFLRQHPECNKQEAYT